jgi:hypothetical protein
VELVSTTSIQAQLKVALIALRGATTAVVLNSASLVHPAISSSMIIVVELLSIIHW